MGRPAPEPELECFLGPLDGERMKVKKRGQTLVEVPSGTFLTVGDELLELVDFYRRTEIRLVFVRGVGDTLEETTRWEDVWMHHGQGYRHATE